MSSDRAEDRKDSDRRLAAFLEHAPEAIFIKDEQGRYTDVGQTFLTLTGRTRDEVIGATDYDLFERDVADRFCAEDAEVRRTGEPRLFEESFAYEGHHLQFLTRKFLLPTGEVAGIGTNITETRASERRLEELAQRLRAAVEGTGVGVYELDLATGRGIWSESAFTILGLTPTPDLVGTYDMWRSVIHPDDLDEVEAEHQAAAERSGPWTFEYRIRRADTGEIRWISAYGAFHPRGDTILSTGAAIDITDHVRTEQALGESERRVRAVLDSVSDAFYAVDGKWRFTLFNRAAEAYFGVPRSEVLGRIAWEVFPQTVGSELERRLQRIMRERTTESFVVSSSAKPGLWIESRVSPHEDGGLAVSFTDVTSRIESERTREILLAELNHRVKNTLGVVQSLARNSFKGEDRTEPLKAFENRLLALARAHSLLTAKSWTSATLEEVVEQSLQPYGRSGASPFLVSGPHVDLTPKNAVNIALALNELATNAVKYGALSVAEGRVRIAWEDEPGGFRLEWQEEGGPEVSEPARTGFGTRLITGSLAAELEGEVEMKFEPSGLVCRVRARR